MIQIRNSQEKIREMFTTPNFFFLESKSVYIGTLVKLMGGFVQMPEAETALVEANEFLENPTKELAENFRVNILKLKSLTPIEELDDLRSRGFASALAFAEQASYRDTRYLKAQVCYGKLLDLLHQTDVKGPYIPELKVLSDKLRSFTGKAEPQELFEEQSLKMQAKNPDHEEYLALMLEYKTIFDETFHDSKRIHILTHELEDALRAYEVEIML